VETQHKEIQDANPQKGALETKEPIKVFTDVENGLATLNDPRFEIVAEPQMAQIFWLIGLKRS